MTIFIRLSLLIFLFCLPSISLGDQDSDLSTILDHLIESYGGEDNLKKMDNMSQEWDLVAMMGNRHGTDSRSVKAPDQLRVDLQYPEKFETRILNGDTGHVKFKGSQPRQVTGMQKDAMRLQLMRLYSPLMLQEKIDSMDLVEDGDLLALSLVDNGLHVYYMVNKENWRIEKVAGSLFMNGNEVKFLTVYSDFAFTDGVLVHRKENKFANGVNTAMLQLRNITFDVEFEEAQFQP